LYLIGEVVIGSFFLGGAMSPSYLPRVSHSIFFFLSSLAAIVIVPS